MDEVEIIDDDFSKENITFGEPVKKCGKTSDGFIETFEKRHSHDLFPKKDFLESQKYPDWEDEIIQPDMSFLNHSPREAVFFSPEQHFLMTAIRCNNYKAFQIAVKKADIHHGRENGPSPLVLATAYAGKKIFSELLERGAQPDVPAETLIQGDTGLHFLARYNLLKKANIALSHSKNIDARNKFNWTALSTGAAYNSFETCKLLLDKGADINAVTEHNRSPLLQSFLETKDLELPALFVRRGADATVRDTSGRNAFFYLTAWMCHFPQADSHSMNMGEKVMMLAETLARKGCPYQTDKAGKKPLDYLWEQPGEKNLNLIQFFSKLDKPKPVVVQKNLRIHKEKNRSHE